MKYKKLIWLTIFIILIFGCGITYSAFSSNINIIGKRDIAKFIFNAETLDQIELPITDIYPGDTKEYAFSVSNNANGKISNVTINYTLTLKTYHFMPLNIELYKEGIEEPIMVFDENKYTRTSENEFICITDTYQMNYDTIELDNYVLKITFPSTYSGMEYTNLVDYIDLEINSWQKIGE